MKKIIFSLFLCLFLSVFSFAQDNSAFNGKTVKSINVKTARIFPGIVKKKFLMQEGDVFFDENYNDAKQALHDMRVFKTIDFNVNENDDGTVSIDIDAKDGYYVFPLIFGAGGEKSTFAAMLMEANLFRFGEMFFVFGVFNSDGYTAMTGLGINDNFFNIVFGDMEYTQYEYEDGSYSTSGMFTAEPEKDNVSNKYDVKSKMFAFSWSKSFYEKASITLGMNFTDVQYNGSDIPNDAGQHNKIIAGVRSYKNMSPRGAGMGALFGMGLSDVQDRLADLPKRKYGYFAGLTYESGSSYIGSDYEISKICLKTVGNIEFTKRNVLTLDLIGAVNFEAPFYEKINSKDVLSGKGIYSKEFRGDQAVGTGLSFTWYIIKSKFGVLTFVPFFENAAIWNGKNPQNHTGAGAIISYQIWRIPFPIGLNYTQNLNDGSQTVSFLFGGGF